MKFNQGDSLFIPFKDGKLMFDSNRRIRMYKSKAIADANAKSWNGAVLVEYVEKRGTKHEDKETPKGERNPFDDESITCICGSDIDIADDFQYCPYCGQRLDYSCLEDMEPVEVEWGGKKYLIGREDTDDDL